MRIVSERPSLYYLPVNYRFRPLLIILPVFAAVCVACVPWAGGDEHLVLNKEGAEVHISGRIVVEAEDGGLLLQDRAGRLWTALPDQITNRNADSQPFVPVDGDKLAAVVLEDLPEGFQVHTTAHYVICHNTSKAYAQWCGALFERLYRAFNNFWERRGITMEKPQQRMVAVVFADQRSYKRYAANDLGDAVESIVGYYNLMSNRVVMYDLTGAQAVRGPKGGSRSGKEINRVLSQPAAGSLIATIIHEATHQIAFNCGLQTRLADIPIWLSEGVAMYFETPDLRSSRGWKGIGAVNQSRLTQFRAYSRNRPADSLRTLLENDLRVQGRSKDSRHQGRQALLDAYAEAWSLTYFLIKSHPDAFIAYMKLLSEKEPLMEDSTEQRIEQFERFFGDLEALDKQFLRQMKRVR